MPVDGIKKSQSSQRPPTESRNIMAATRLVLALALVAGASAFSSAPG